MSTKTAKTHHQVTEIKLLEGYFLNILITRHKSITNQ